MTRVDSRVARRDAHPLRNVLTALGVVSATVALHEAAHALAAARVGGTVTEVGIGFGPPLFHLRVRHLPVVVRALPLGGYAAVEAEQVPPRRRIPLLLAGPLANIAVGIPLVLAFRRHPIEIPLTSRRAGLTGVLGTVTSLAQAAARGPGSVARLAGSINVGLGLMNLLPVYPLDGGHVVLNAMEDRGVPLAIRTLFARLTAAVFLTIAQVAMRGDMRWLSARPGHAQARGPG